MTDQSALPPRPLTVGRELPARRDQVAASPRVSRQALPAERQRAAGAHRPPKRPDPRPMRVVYGAGAVAAMSIMAVGLVQPDWTATGDQSATDDSGSATGDQSAIAGLDTSGSPKTEAGGSFLVDGGATANVQVRHVIRYVYLKPGQTAPPGATVIGPDATPRQRGNAAHPGGSGHNSNGGSRPTPVATQQPRNNPGPVATARPTTKPTPRVTPPPTPKPTPKSRQSGKP